MRLEDERGTHLSSKGMEKREEMKRLGRNEIWEQRRNEKSEEEQVSKEKRGEAQEELRARR